MDQLSVSSVCISSRDTEVYSDRLEFHEAALGRLPASSEGGQASPKESLRQFGSFVLLATGIR
jgi:hypothetical protein